MRGATCTPVDFSANEHFFGRDSGLLCRGLQAAGVDCICVMLGEGSPDEPPDMTRTSSVNLVDPKWWKGQALDFVVLYAWGDPKYEGVALAIRRAGIFLIQNLDTAGVESPYADFHRWWTSYRDLIRGPLPLLQKARLAARLCRDFIPSLYEKRRLRMMDQSDLIAAVSPPAAASLRNFARALGSPSVAEKLIVLPHPVPSLMGPVGPDKETEVLCVGRWLEEDAHQKDPRMMLAVLHDFLSRTPGWRARVVGRGSTALASITAAWPESLQSRISLVDAVPRYELRSYYQRASILLCASRFESFHISSAEAVACGCSIVVADHPLLSSTTWFASRASGTLAKRRDLSSLGEALDQEAAAWAAGLRDPVAISSGWRQELLAPEVGAKIIDLVKYKRPFR